MARTPALDIEEEIVCFNTPPSLQRRLKERGYSLRQPEVSTERTSTIPPQAFFMVTSFKGEPVYSGPYQGSGEELQIARSFYGKARQTYYAGFGCGETVRLQSLLKGPPTAIQGR